MKLPTPPWTPSDPSTPPPLPPRGGSVVALVAAPEAVVEGWAASAALDVAQGWGAAGTRVVLADGGLTAALLSRELGDDPGEGLVDAVQWGVSVQRVARRPEGRPFFVVGAGTAVADGAEVLRNPRWAALCAGFRDAGVTLAVFVPADDPSLSGILDQASHVVVVAPPGHDVPTLLAGFRGTVLGVVGRKEAFGGVPSEVREGAPGTEPGAIIEVEAIPEPGPEPPPAPGVEAPADPPDRADEPWPELPADPEQEPAAGWPDPLGPLGDDPSDLPVSSRADVPTFEEIVEESEPAEGGSRRGRGLVVSLLLLALAAAFAGGVWLGLFEVPFISGGGEEAPGATPAPSMAAQPAHATSGVLAYSVAVGAYQDPAVAQSLAAELRQSFPGTLFTAVPVDVQGTLVYRVLAGPAADSTGAGELAASLAAATGLDPSGWMLRATPKAFQLGEMADREAAQRRAEVLAALDIPAYVLPVEYSDASTRFRVYAGAFADEAEASFLSALLRERGLTSSTFSDRIGRLPE